MWKESPARNMSENDILEMESVCDTDEFDGDVQLGMVDEETGERTTFVFRSRFVVLAFAVMGTVWILSQLLLW